MTLKMAGSISLGRAFDVPRAGVGPPPARRAPGAPVEASAVDREQRKQKWRENLDELGPELGEGKQEHVTGIEGGPARGVAGERALRAERIMQTPLMIAAVLTVPSVALTETHVGGTLETIATFLNWGTWLAFVLEMVVMLALVPDRRKYLRHHPLELIIIVLTPPVLPASLQSLRVVRLLRLLRLLRLAQLSHRLFSTQGLQYAALMSLVTALAGGSIFRAFERGNQALSEWESIYWAISSMTTLGSKWEPTTTGSEITAVIVQLIGISFMAMLTGAIAQRFLTPRARSALGAADND